MLVTLTFRLYDGQGELVDEVSAEEPLRYVHGYAQIVPGLEARLEGVEQGENLRIQVAPEDAFGAHVPSALLEIDPRDFPDSDRVEVGSEIVATGPDGLAAVYRVLEVNQDAIIVDLNHPLAGQAVRFEVCVREVVEATEEQLDAAQMDADQRIAHTVMEERRRGAAVTVTTDDKRRLDIVS